jgi:hypothetical protein
VRAVASPLLQYHLELSQSTYNHHTTHENDKCFAFKVESPLKRDI